MENQNRVRKGSKLRKKILNWHIDSFFLPGLCGIFLTVSFFTKVNSRWLNYFVNTWNAL